MSDHIQKQPGRSRLSRSIRPKSTGCVGFLLASLLLPGCVAPAKPDASSEKITDESRNSVSDESSTASSMQASSKEEDKPVLSIEPLPDESAAPWDRPDEEEDITGVYSLIVPGGRKSVLKITRAPDGGILISKYWFANTGLTMYDEVSINGYSIDDPVTVDYTNEYQGKQPQSVCEFLIERIDGQSVYYEEFGIPEETGIYKRDDSIDFSMLES